MIVLLFTGGTISMKFDAAAGGAVPTLSGEDIVSATRGLSDVAPLEVEQWGRFPGPHMTVERMWALRNRIAEHLARPEVEGVVVTHGTDTLEESAYLVARSLPPWCSPARCVRRATSDGTGHPTCSTQRAWR